MQGRLGNLRHQSLSCRMLRLNFVFLPTCQQHYQGGSFCRRGDSGVTFLLQGCRRRECLKRAGVCLLQSISIRQLYCPVCNMAMVLNTSNTPERDVGNYLGNDRGLDITASLRLLGVGNVLTALPRLPEILGVRFSVGVQKTS